MKEPMTNERIKYLESALKMVASGEQEFICNALLYSNDRLSIYKVCSELVREIKDYISPHGTLNSWVEYNVLGGGSESPSFRFMRDFRVRWLKHLIKQEKAKLVVDKP